MDSQGFLEEKEKVVKLVFLVVTARGEHLGQGAPLERKA
jgi:hypothetical protein